MSVDGTITAEVTQKEAVSGSNVVLTIDSKLQKITEDTLAANIEKDKNRRIWYIICSNRWIMCSYECKDWRSISTSKLSRL